MSESSDSEYSDLGSDWENNSSSSDDSCEQESSGSEDANEEEEGEGLDGSYWAHDGEDEYYYEDDVVYNDYDKEESCTGSSTGSSSSDSGVSSLHRFPYENDAEWWYELTNVDNVTMYATNSHGIRRKGDYLGQPALAFANTTTHMQYHGVTVYIHPRHHLDSPELGITQEMRDMICTGRAKILDTWKDNPRFGIQFDLMPKEKVLVAHGPKARNFGCSWQAATFASLHTKYFKTLRSHVENEWNNRVGAMKQVVQQSHRLESNWEEEQDMDDVDRFDWQLDALMECVEHGVPFVDTAFAPCHASVGKDNLNPVWLPPEMYLKRHENEQNPRTKQLIVGKMEPNDIDQGALGNCWLMAAIAGLVEEHPGREDGYRIRALFGLNGNPFYGNEVGAYVVRLNRAGVWKYIVVDDYLPVHDKSVKPMFGKNKQEDNELWVAILEKAFAKVYGSYGNLEKGSTRHGVTDMTQDPGMDFAFDHATNRIRFSGATTPGTWKEDEDEDEDDGPLDMHPNKFFDTFLTHWDNQRYVMNLSTPGKDLSGYMHLNRAVQSHEVAKLSKKYKAMGLATGHAYTLLGVRHVTALDGTKYRLCQIRNPWGDGRGEFKGKFGDNSLVWNQISARDKAAMNYTKQDDGLFWMTLRDVFHYFAKGGVSFVMDSKSTLSCRGYCYEDFGPAFAIHLQNYTPGAQITAMASQIPARGRGSTDDLLGLKLRLFRKRDDDRYECPSNGRFVWETTCAVRPDVGSAFDDLEEGEYILTAATRFQRTGKFTLTVHTGEEVECDLRPFDIDNEYKKAKFLNGGRILSGYRVLPAIDVGCEADEDVQRHAYKTYESRLS